MESFNALTCTRLGRVMIQHWLEARNDFENRVGKEARGLL
jgi:hypothetical protein